MHFNRPPRIQNPLWQHKVKIPAPPSLPAKPKLNWLTLALPLVAGGLAIGLMILLSPSASFVSYLFFFTFMGASVLAALINHSQQGNQYRKLVADALNEYVYVLDKKNSELQSLVKKQNITLWEINPGLTECLHLAKQADSRLGERRPEDDDFLSFRIGLGEQASGIEIETPSEEENYHELFKGFVVQANQYKRDFSILKNSPVTTSLRRVGHLGVSGNADVVLQFITAALIHLLTHHWVAEVEVAAFGEASSGKSWQWLNAIPHRSHLFPKPYIQLSPSDQGRNPSVLALERELLRRQAYRKLAQAQHATDTTANLPATYTLPVLVVIFDHVPNVYDQAGFSLLLKEGWELGAYGIFLSDRTEDIPGECGAVVELSGSNLSYLETGAEKIPLINIQPDIPGQADVEAFARSLAAINWLVPVAVTEPPQRLNLLEMFGVSDADDLPLEKWWDGEYPYGYLRAPIGRFSPSADLIFDLNEGDLTHGPHGIIGGITGSGKSELLRTLVLSLALTHHPYDINFALIDYKGGGAFNEFKDLPHVVGVVTDIENHADYANRVIQSLRGEIITRKQILNEAAARSGLKRPHVDDYRQLPVKRPLPRLIIIFDEYAEFKDQHPEHSKKLINIARQGRSLGVHLILCTQNIASAIDQQVRQNSKFRVCLRVGSAEDSKELIGIPDAWQLPTGQAFMQVKQPQKFQVAFTGEPVKPRKKPPLPDDAIVLIQPGNRRDVIYPSNLRQSMPEPSTEAGAIAQKIFYTAQALGISDPPKVWPDPLPDRLYLPNLLNENSIPMLWNGGGWDTGLPPYFGQILGLLDDPVRQRQPLYFSGVENSSGHLLVFGQSGSGKSSLLKTFAMSVALMNSPAQVHIYCMDFGGQNSLKVLEILPHLPEVGGVITANEKERINRLFSMLRNFIFERGKLYEAKGVNDFLGYNRQVNTSERLPLIYILIDNLNEQFRAANPGFIEQLSEIIRSGRSAGIHIIITANLIRDIPSGIFADIDEKIVLRQARREEVTGVVEKAPVHFIEAEEGQIPPGRGLRKGYPVLELQAALPVEGESEEEQHQNLIHIIQQMNQTWKRERPVDVEVLPAFIAYAELAHRYPKEDIGTSEQKPVFETYLGVNQEMLKAVGLSIDQDSSSFLIASMTPKLGKTSLLKTMISVLAEVYKPEQVRFIIIDFHGRRSLRQLRELPHARYIGRQDDLNLSLDELEAEIVHRKKAWDLQFKDNPEEFDESELLRKLGLIVIVIDDFNAFRNRVPGLQAQLYRCLTDGEEFGVRLIIAENVAFLGGGDIITHVKRHGCGILFGGSDSINIFNEAKTPYGQKTSNLPPGRGYLIKHGQVQLFQAAVF